MKKLLLLATLMLLLVAGKTQNITAAEYFIDTDPGVGNGIAIPFTAGPNPAFTASVPVTSLANGFHFVAIRTKDADGTWSLFEKRGFYVSNTTADVPNIMTAEYFIDTDPGLGNGIALTITSGDTTTFLATVPVGTLSNGFHFVAIRTKDTDGKWGLFEKRGFYISDATTDIANISAAEYFIDTDPGTGNGTAISIPSPVSLYQDSLVLPLGSLPLGSYRIGIRVKNDAGEWSLLESKVFNVCETYGAQSEMTYQIEGNRVFFTNNSLFFDTISWRFGDNTFDTTLNPIKIYARAGIYNLQLITGNKCGVDTLTQAIEMRGLQRVNPARAGNAGISTLMFEGFGFTATTEVKIMVGSQVYTPVSKSFINSNRIKANFNLTGFVPGVYRAVATIGSAFDTLANALIVEDNIPVNLALGFTDGQVLKRPGRADLSGSIFNKGSHDAIMVPYVAATNIIPGVTPVNMNLYTSTLMVPLQNEGIFQQTSQYLATHGVSVDVMSANYLDSARNLHLVAYYRTRIAGRSSVFEYVKSPHAGVTHSYQLASMVLGPLLDSYALLDSIHTDYQACYSSFLKQAVEKQLNIQVNDANWNNCFAPAFDTLMRTLANVSQNPAFETYGIPMQASFSALLAKMATCSGSGVPSNLGGVQFKRIIQDVMNNWIYLEDIDSLDADCIDTTVQVFSRMMNNKPVNIAGRESRVQAGGCTDCPGALVFPEMCEQCLPILQAGKAGKKLKIKGRAWGANSAVKGCKEWCENASIDPNAKYGPGDNNENKYINHKKEVNYTITFENLVSATAPAAFVEITDSINKNVFDISTLNLGVFSWGDSLIAAEPNEQNVSILKTIKPTHPNFLRIDATTDTSAGIVRWRFWTVDTVTLQLTDSPAEGFLPPNTDGVRGSGYVTYSIAPKSTVTNGTILKNKAAIVFDENAPIVTNEWEYRIDTLLPSSRVATLRPVITTQEFTVNWSGSDAHAEIDRYSVYVSINDSAYRIWQSFTESTSAVFTGEFGKTYKFFSVALDKAGNFEEAPLNPLTNPDATTSLQVATSVIDLGREKLLIYPTLTTGIVHIRSEQLLQAELFSLTGQKIANYQIRNTGTIDLSNLSSGVYLLKLSSSDKAVKIVKL